MCKTLSCFGLALWLCVALLAAAPAQAASLAAAPGPQHEPSSGPLPGPVDIYGARQIGFQMGIVTIRKIELDDGK